MVTDTLSLLFASDLHFGHGGSIAEEMADAFALIVFPLIPETDVFFINGDFFDTLVMFDSHGFDPIYDTILTLFQLCHNHNVTLRILQGTYSHDRTQLKRFNTFYRNSGYTFPFRIVENVDLEEIQTKGRSLRVLYVPDDLPVKSSEEALDLIHAKLNEKGWDWVDYGCMHGFFDFTHSEGASTHNVVVYREEQFPFVRKMIDVGHVHQHRAQGKVISNGSFDRGGHGDESPKGLIQVTDYPDHYTAHFVENTQAAVYNTINLVDASSTEEIRRIITDRIAAIHSPRRIALRFITDSHDHKEAIRAFMEEHYPDIKIKTQNSKKQNDQIFEGSALVTTVERIPAPTLKTIATFVRSHLSEHSTLTEEKISVHLELSLND